MGFLTDGPGTCSRSLPDPISSSCKPTQFVSATCNPRTPEHVRNTITVHTRYETGLTEVEGQVSITDDQVGLTKTSNAAEVKFTCGRVKSLVTGMSCCGFAGCLSSQVT